MSALTLRPTETLAAGGYAKRDRVRAALCGEVTDRPPVSFWRHIAPGGSAGALANFTVDFFARRFDLDIAKIMSDIRYPIPMYGVRTPEDWLRVEDWGGRETEFTRAYVSTVRQVRALLGPAYPIVVTVYSAVTWAQIFVTEYPQLLRDFEAAPSLVHHAMANIASNLRRHVSACIEAGADGIFLSILGCDDSIPAPIYREIGRPYDLMILQGAANGWLNLLHVHGDHPSLRLEEALDYPVHGLSWASHTTGHSIASLRPKTDRCLMAGWDHTSPLLTDAAAAPETLLEAWTGQAATALAEAGGKGLILAPGCSAPNQSTPQALTALRQSVDRL
ncbi:uroporphyrinogen decarboxylase [Rhodoblastus acidophilus]|uniref:uroporphyrinogen decarboxylase family protein n=1 Tax=Rhodoblastus acidophilus TaxID=1074 RepID=UPI002225B1EA|nr:uroporphyrinogen decarboxylase family protein [Rhodoblastus acidophilus]MCW2318666.1 uroporphyrinogen decarboxylase [Rhodoblastus acidophilus]